MCRASMGATYYWKTRDLLRRRSLRLLIRVLPELCLTHLAGQANRTADETRLSLYIYFLIIMDKAR